MKKMTSITILSSLLFLFSCSQNENSTLENPEGVYSKTQEKQNDERFLSGPSLYLAIVENKLAELEIEKKELIAAIENGNDKATEALEENQSAFFKMEEFKEYLIGRIPRVRPTPKKPGGCKYPQLTNCKIGLNGIEGISQHEAFVLKQIEFFDSKNEHIEVETEMIEDDNGNSAILIKTENISDATMVLTITSELGETILDVSVFQNK